MVVTAGVAASIALVTVPSCAVPGAAVGVTWKFGGVSGNGSLGLARYCPFIICILQLQFAHEAVNGCMQRYGPGVIDDG